MMVGGRKILQRGAPPLKRALVRGNMTGKLLKRRPNACFVHMRCQKLNGKASLLQRLGEAKSWMGALGARERKAPDDQNPVLLLCHSEFQ
jgi:hypothetical protein